MFSIEQRKVAINIESNRTRTELKLEWIDLDLKSGHWVYLLIVTTPTTAKQEKICVNLDTIRFDYSTIDQCGLTHSFHCDESDRSARAISMLTQSNNTEQHHYSHAVQFSN